MNHRSFIPPTRFPPASHRCVAPGTLSKSGLAFRTDCCFSSLAGRGSWRATPGWGGPSQPPAPPFHQPGGACPWAWPSVPTVLLRLPTRLRRGAGVSPAISLRFVSQPIGQLRFVLLDPCSFLVEYTFKFLCIHVFVLNSFLKYF